MDRSVVLDICKHPDPPVPVLVLRQGDGGSVTLRISVMEDGEPFDLADCEARFMARLRNGKVVIDPCRKEGGNALSYTLPSALTAQAGSVELAYVAVYRGEDWVASTDRMRFQILEGVDLTAEEAENVLGEFLALKSRLDELLEDAEGRAEEQQSAWLEQMTAQKEQFDDLKRLIEDAIESLEAVVIVSIPNADIDALWADYQHQTEGGTHE